MSPLRFGREGIFPAIRKAFGKSFALVELSNELRDVVVVNAVPGMVIARGNGVTRGLASDGIELAQGDFVFAHPESLVFLRAPAEDHSVSVDPFPRGGFSGLNLIGWSDGVEIFGSGELGREIVAFRQDDGRLGSAFFVKPFQEFLRLFLIGVNEREAFGGDSSYEEVESFFDLLVVEIVLSSDAESMLGERLFDGVVSSNDERDSMSRVETRCGNEKENDGEKSHGDQARSSLSGLS